MARIIRLTFALFHIAMPFILWGIWRALQLAWISISSVWAGIPSASHTIADDITERAVRAGFPTLQANRLHRIALVIAGVTIVVGWIIAAYLTVMVMGVVLSIIW